MNLEEIENTNKKTAHIIRKKIRKTRFEKRKHKKALPYSAKLIIAKQKKYNV